MTHRLYFSGCLLFFFQTGDVVFFIVCLVVFIFSFGTAMNAFLYPRMGKNMEKSSFFSIVVRSIVDHTYWPVFGDPFEITTEMGGNKFSFRILLLIGLEYEFWISLNINFADSILTEIFFKTRYWGYYLHTRSWGHFHCYVILFFDSELNCVIYHSVLAIT